MPLYGVNPVLDVEIVLYRALLVWIVDWLVYIVNLVVVFNHFVEDRHAKLGKSHNSNDFVLFIPVENPCMCKDSILNANLYKLSENRNRFLSKLLTLWL